MLVAVAASALVSSVTVVSAATPAQAASRAGVADSRPAWAVAGADLGPVSSSTPLNDIRIYLAGRDPQGLAAYAGSVADPKSSNYHNYLTPAEVQARFGPSTAQVDAVQSWLKASGLTVTGANQHYVTASGSPAAAERAFGTTLHNYRAQGGVHHAPAGAVNVPTTVSSAILGVAGLDDGRPMAHTSDDLPGPSNAFVPATPCSTSFGQNPATTEPPTFGHTGAWVPCGYTPQQLRSAYGVTNIAGGKGVTVAVVDAYASPTITSDVATYNANHQMPGFAPGQLTQNLPSSWNSTAECGDWYSEETLDIEAVHNMAPGANVDYVAASSCNDTDFLDAFSRIVDNRLATIVSNSWSDFGDDTVTAAVRSAYEQELQQGAAEGIGFYFASGDCGAEDPATPCGAGYGSTKPQANFPTDDPWATAVGGTTLAVGSNGQQQWQAGWGVLRSTLNATGDGWTPDLGTGYPAAYKGGSGGGTSEDYAQPPYQAGIVPASLSKTLPDGTQETTPHRVIPDVAMVGDPDTGMLIGQTVKFADGTVKYFEFRFGGTSLSAPLFAGMQAVAQQIMGVPIGFANFCLYSRFGTTAIDDITDTPLGSNNPVSAVRNDHTASNDPNSPIVTHALAFGHDGQLHATVGYDDVTGVGAPSVGYVMSYRPESGT
ncbi:MAG: S8/S53 family peptidase, partial [Catenulispora sp.]|nr:S8/S53 family peptidase [Catenulispora sp.]